VSKDDIGFSDFCALYLVCEGLASIFWRESQLVDLIHDYLDLVGCGRAGAGGAAAVRLN